MIEQLNVSRETISRLEHYEALLRKWTVKINLVSKSTLADLWARHILDSVQLYQCFQTTPDLWLDIGSGGGLPGIVCATIAKEKHPNCKFTLIESDARKSVFLQTAIRELDLNATVITKRIDQVPPIRADILSARALAELSALCAFAEQHLAEGGTCLFPKGKTWKNEVKIAQESWHFDYEAITSKTDHEAVILKLGNISRV